MRISSSDILTRCLRILCLYISCTYLLSVANYAFWLYVMRLRYERKKVVYQHTAKPGALCLSYSVSEDAINKRNQLNCRVMSDNQLQSIS